MNKKLDTPKATPTIFSEEQTIGEGFFHGLNERLKVLVGLQQSQQDGYIHLSSKTNQEIKREIARLKSDTEKMKKQFTKLKSNLTKSYSKTPQQNGER